MKAKSAIYYIAILTFTIIPLSLAYYIFVNTVLAKSVLPNIRLSSSDVSFYTQVELTEEIEVKALEIVPERVEISFEGEEMSVGSRDIGFDVDTYDLVNYGKGDNIFKVISEGLNLFKGVEVNVEYTISVDTFLNKLGIVIDSENPSKLESSYFYCNTNQFFFSSINKDRIRKDLVNSVKAQSNFQFKLESYIDNEDEKLLYLGCLKYKKDYPIITDRLINKLSNDTQKVDDYLVLHSENKQPKWKLKDSQSLRNLIINYQITNDIRVDEGEYEIINNREIYLYEPYTEGLYIDVESTESSIHQWIASNNLESDPIVYVKTTPKVLSYGLPIKDFSQQLGIGNTRIELVRNGIENFIIAYTMFGLDEINKTIIESGEEFSYIEAIAPQPNGTTKSGRPIAGGICNSTTTLFRAALEAGLPVTDRSYHAYFVQSYEWGYPLNIVDAAYYTDPKVDFKFKNDTGYPILVKVEYSKDNDYQYNTVKLLTSSEAPLRSVELANWKVWDKYSSTNFKGSFDRTVSENGEILFKDNFYSHYL